MFAFNKNILRPRRVLIKLRFGIESLAVAALLVLITSSGAVARVGVQQTPTDLLVNIVPEEAVLAGAQWKTEGGTWNSSGNQSALTAGKYEIEFYRLAEWEEPVEVSVNIIEGHVTKKTAAYKRLNNFNIGEIPPQTIWHGKPVRFIIHSDKMGPGSIFSQEIVGNVTGNMSLDSSAGHFSYAPDSQDKEPFSVIFRAVSGEHMVVQTVSFTPVPNIQPEQSAFGLEPIHAFPSVEDSDYIIEDDVIGETKVFNWVERPTRIVTIIGKTLIIKEGHPNGLYERYNSHLDIAQLTIHAEKVIIGSPFHLPQTNVSIFARELSFEDPPNIVSNSEKAQIITTPWDPIDRAGTGEPFTCGGQTCHIPNKGKQGLKGGDISLNVGVFYFTEPGYDDRFISQGGKGQQGGPGMPGPNGSSLASTGDNPFGNFYGSPPNWQSTIYVKRIDRICLSYEGGLICRADSEKLVAEKGAKDGWPTKGWYAVGAGIPGDPGDGGDMYINIASHKIANYVNKNGGFPGDMGENYSGGTPGNPNPAYKYKLYVNKSISGSYISHNWVSIGSNTTEKGADAPAPGPDKPVGQAGLFTQVGNSLSWLSPHALRMIVSYGQDVYLYGYVNEAREIFFEYSEILEACLSSSCRNDFSEDWVFEFEQINSELLALVHRIDSNLDYFANPAGWVPMLSFELTRKAFDNEVKHAINSMYLSYWIAKAETTLINRKQGMQNMIALLKSGIDESTALLTKAIQNLPVIEVEARNIAGEVAVLQQSLKWLEEELIERAENNVEDRHKLDRWKKTARFLGAVCTIVPIGQPVLGGIGQGLAVLSNIPNEVTEDPWLLLKDMKYLEATVDKDFSNFEDNVKGLVDEIKKVNVDDLAAFKTSYKGVTTKLSPVIQTVKKLNGLRKEFQVPKSEVDAELQKLKASDPEFVQLADEVATLISRKESLNSQIVDTMQIIARVPAEIEKDYLAADEMNREISGVSKILNPRILVHLKEIEKRAKERLLKYQYYLAKAYEYRQLVSYPGELRLTALVEETLNLATTVQAENDLTPDKFNTLATIYEEELAGIAEEILQWYIDNPPSKRVVDTFQIKDDDISNLNNEHSITLNLMEQGLFFPDEEDIRLADISVKTDFMDWSLDSASATKATTNINIEHFGLSKLVKDGKIFQFKHYSETTSNPLNWSGRYNGLFNEYVEEEPSPADASLLKSLLYDGATDSDLLIYSRPGGWADISISKVDHPDNDTRVDIVKLPLTISYDYRKRRADLVRLQIEVSQEKLQPLFTIDAIDINGRSDGMGHLSRYYVIGATVIVEVPNRHGTWTFKKWVDQEGKELGNNRTLGVYLSKDKVVRAVFIAGESDGDGLPDDWEWTTFGTLDRDGAGDYDNDLLVDAKEYYLGTNPLDSDFDDDGYTDGRDVAPTDSSRWAHDIAPLIDLIFVPNGDLNRDSCVDRLDLAALMSIVRGISQPDLSVNYDLNDDEQINIADARELVTLFTNPRGSICQ